jgi:hypothetical protein
LSDKHSVEQFDLPGIDDEGVDVEPFALFMRDTKAPPVDQSLAATNDAQDGSQIFNAIGCNVCHTRSIVTASPGTLINGGAMRVANAGTRDLGRLPDRPRIRTPFYWPHVGRSHRSGMETGVDLQST